VPFEDSEGILDEIVIRGIRRKEFKPCASFSDESLQFLPSLINDNI
jgi:hypothetical protein